MKRAALYPHDLSVDLEPGSQQTLYKWSAIIDSVGAAGGQVHCLPDGDVVISLQPGTAPAVPALIQTIFHGIAVSQMASRLADRDSRRQVQEVALRLAHHAIVELINSVLA
ncbi:MAG TPA: hypothetical protein VKB88_40095 [Bryobacteraceae bacterium]|nr:hypothetical protein [Bryobacteraceae bacterium]